ncbi:MAG: hypothetical protein ACOCYB_10905 [Alkalispirochaeta sp.]
MNAVNRFPIKLSAIFLVLVTVTGMASVLITIGIFDQRLNRTVAASMAAELAPLVASQDGEVESVIHYMMVMNPAVEIYILDRDGTIRAFFASPGPEVQLEAVDVDPMRRDTCTSYFTATSTTRRRWSSKTDTFCKRC